MNQILIILKDLKNSQESFLLLNMDKAERLSRSDRARKRRSSIRIITKKRIENLYLQLHRLKIKRQKIKTKLAS